MRYFLIILSFLAITAWGQPEPVDSIEVEVQQEEVVEQPKTLAFGYFSYDEVLHSMPAYTQAKTNIETLAQQFKDEASRSESEFSKRYEAFLEEQHDLAPSILKKRQAELQDMMERNIAFKEESQRLLQEAERDAYAPLKDKISAAVAQLGKERGLVFILNTDRDAVPWVDTDMGVDLNTILKLRVRTINSKH